MTRLTILSAVAGASLFGLAYCFGNEEAKTLFMKDPEGNLAKAQAFYSSKKQ
jgi:hypothetical protein